jgi:hypothetical protein
MSLDIDVDADDGDDDDDVDVEEIVDEDDERGANAMSEEGAE